MWYVLAAALLLAGSVVMYNRLVRLREMADSAWADIDVQLKRRHDLIPSLVETVKGYAGHERATLESVIEARSRAVAAHGPGESTVAEGRLVHSLRGLFALAESYPEIRAADGFLELQEKLVEVEDHLQNARRYYNAVVRDYNTRIAQVPSNVVARAFGFRERDPFSVEDSERAVPRVEVDGEESGES